MRVVFHPAFHDDIESLFRWLKDENPPVIAPLWRDIEEAIGRISVWPEMAPAIEKRRQMRALTLVRYPYRIFYRVKPDVVEILHIRHSSRAPWAEDR
jgi:plasmid stabilization system protein ParE